MTVIQTFFVGIVVFALLAAMGFSGLALKTAGGRFCLHEMQVLLLLSSSDSRSDSDEFYLSAFPSVIVSFDFLNLRRESSMSDSDEAYSCAAGCFVDGVVCCVLPCTAACVRL